MSKFLIVFFVAFLVFASFLFVNLILAEEEPPPETPPTPPPACVPGPEVCSSSPPYRCNDFAVYKCANNFCGKAGGAMEQGIEWYECVNWFCSNGCSSSGGTNVVSGPHGPDQIKPYGSVPDYQICPATYNNWGTAPSTPQCSGACYPAPDLKPLDDADLLPKNVSDGSKYKLPINFGWEDNVEKEVAKSPNFCTVGSYEFNIVNPPLSKIVTDTQLQTVDDSAYKLECQIKSGGDYLWRVRACLNAGGEDCGEWPNGQSFGTNLAPELIAPYDADWAGLDMGGTSTPTTLDWCDVEKAESYRLGVYIIQGGQKVCHPNLLAAKNGREFCDSWVLRKQRRDPEQIEKTLFSDFLDEDMYFFTGTTTYAWEILTCTDDSGIDCGEPSQQWTFKTSEKAAVETFLVAPPDDPQGLKPVGFPLVLDWRKDAGINSWWYKIDSKQELARTSRSRSFDYPELSLNTFYQWQALSCFDYEGKKCQNSWSDIYTFKTTGQPPNLTYPATEAAGIPIPVNFKWDAVSGAKSYVFEIKGEEKITDKPEITFDFPDLLQETNYSWRVKTCIRDNGQVCGNYGSSQNFKTFRISPPLSPTYPQNRGMLFTDEHFLSWEKVVGAKAYQYEVKLLSKAAEEQSQDCSVPPLKTELVNSSYTELGCLGRYQWQVRSCLDQNCQETSNWSNSWTFTFLEGGMSQGGLVPCGRATDNQKTPWNEREPCQIKHLFLSIKIILDFLLFRITPIILVLLTIATAVTLYTALGQAIAMAQIMSLWKAAGIGLSLIFFAWTLVNVLLKLTGFNIGIFGNWYNL
ncbi:MAG: hypothetical protein HYV47_02190 [Candidatus Nealsonbacteria bacterium]|nr:hypothetical protein [Candidatus Nealsonbacteria bacterium]